MSYTWKQVLVNISKKLKNDIKATDTNINNILKKSSEVNRTFPPKIGASTYFNTYNQEESYVKKMLDDFKELNLESLQQIFHLELDKENKTIKINEDVNLFKNLIVNYSKVKIDTIKIHCVVSYEEVLSYGEEKFKNDYMEKINYFLDLADSLSGIKYFVVFNELAEVYFQKSFKDYTINLLKKIKDRNYIPCISFSYNCLQSSYKSENVWIYENLDYILYNFYPYISTKGEYTTIDDSISAWDYNFKMLNKLYTFKKKNSKIIISETGVLDRWEFLENPARWEEIEGSVPTNGEAAYIYFKGLFESSLDNFRDIEEIWIWYADYAITKKIGNLIGNKLGVL